MRLRQLTGLEQEKLRAEYKEIMELIEYLKSILANLDLQMKIIKDELLK
jgi:DNA gyrase subunit A